MSNKWRFQRKAAQKLCDDLKNPRFTAAVLAGAVGIGKSAIIIHTLNILTTKYPKHRILVLTHAQKSLKHQFLKMLESNVPVSTGFEFGTLDQQKQVTIAIPQEFNKYDGPRFQIVIVDEAHLWYTSNSVAKGIIERFRIKKKILATGSVSFFNRHNRTSRGLKYAITYIPGDEAIKRGLYSKLNIDLVLAEDPRNVEDCLALAFKKAKINNDSHERPVVICKCTAQAISANRYLESIGFTVALATSRNDPNNLEIEKFNRGDKTALILVGRGLVGLNIPEADLMIDLKRSKNIDIVLQYYARLLRKQLNGQKKCFLRLTTRKEWNEDVILLHIVRSLNQSKIFKTFCGDNLDVKVAISQNRIFVGSIGYKSVSGQSHPKEKI